MTVCRRCGFPTWDDPDPLCVTCRVTDTLAAGVLSSEGRRDALLAAEDEARAVDKEREHLLAAGVRVVIDQTLAGHLIARPWRADLDGGR